MNLLIVALRLLTIDANEIRFDDDGPIEPATGLADDRHDEAANDCCAPDLRAQRVDDGYKGPEE